MTQLQVFAKNENLDLFVDAIDASFELEAYEKLWCQLKTSFRSIAIIESRRLSDEGIRRARKLTTALVNDHFTVVSGFAEGIDRVAHETAITKGGQSIAVIGTPLGHVYPKSNAKLQEKIANEFLLISQVPVERYESQNPKSNRFFFPERNKTMSALTEATVIIEARETSGALIQAREVLKQGRKLFILNSCFEHPKLTWPTKFESQGAIRICEHEELRHELVEQAP